MDIDRTGAQLCDLTGVTAVDEAVSRYRRRGAEIQVLGRNGAAETLMAPWDATTSRTCRAARH